MPQLPKFEDWKRPWEEGEFDAEKAAKLIYNLHKDKETAATKVTEKDTKITELTDSNKELQAKVDTFESKDLSDVQKLQRENEKLKADLEKKPATPEFDAEKAKLEIALEKGLTKSQAARLVGSTQEELAADAEAYIKEHNLGGDGEGGSNGGGPPSMRPRSNLKTGNDDKGSEPDETNPAKLYDVLPPRR